MPGGHVDRGVLSSNYQQPGDIYSDTKTEAAFEVLAQQIDQNWDDYNGQKVELSSTTPGDSGAHNVGSAPIDGVTGANVHAQLSDIKNQISQQTLGQIADGSLTLAKLDSILKGAAISGQIYAYKNFGGL